MKVVLRTDITGVGKRGDIIDVAGGYARNHLLPSGRAMVATPGVEEQAAAMRRSRDLRDSREREAAETVARTLVGHPVTVTARASAAGRLFGSVSAIDIVEHVEAQTGAVIDRRKLVLPDAIKELGQHQVRVELHDDVVFELTVDVVAAEA
ncbi:MAG: 50S ribosomal protein L9 [Actinomycetota bacterium]|jgi:large subunit ribosomal protein L9|nr:50S ribosomal protein L9 [Actinomycetota bacterium]MDA8292910.1 50S ribosomal protein L9 [Actinomycetota bacterium]